MPYEPEPLDVEDQTLHDFGEVVLGLGPYAELDSYKASNNLLACSNTYGVLFYVDPAGAFAGNFALPILHSRAPPHSPMRLPCDWQQLNLNVDQYFCCWVALFLLAALSGAFALPAFVRRLEYFTHSLPSFF